MNTFLCTCPIGFYGRFCEDLVCGDGLVAGEEHCDDGNREGGDGCDGQCRSEAGWVCPQPGVPCKRKLSHQSCLACLSGLGGENIPIVTTITTNSTSDDCLERICTHVGTTGAFVSGVYAMVQTLAAKFIPVTFSVTDGSVKFIVCFD